VLILVYLQFFFSSRRRHTRFSRDWSSDVCSSDLQPDKTEQREPDNNTYYGNQWVNIPNLFINNKAKHIINIDNQGKPPDKQSYSLPGLSLRKQYQRSRHEN